jgi:hypothetical protein
MFNPDDVPPVESDEILARYATQSKHFRSIDHTARPEMFMPHPHQDLSVTRHREATEDEIWAVGGSVAMQMRKTLHGRCDIKVLTCLQSNLRVKEAPIVNEKDSPDNPNHADIQGWPADKSAQKSIALELAAGASRLLTPPFTPPAASPDSP